MAGSGCIPDGQGGALTTLTAQGNCVGSLRKARLRKDGNDPAKCLRQPLEGLEKKIAATEKRLDKEIKTVETRAATRGYSNGHSSNDTRHIA